MTRLRSITPARHILEDATLPLDNTPAEQALRAMAHGRKNYLFDGHAEAGENLAGLASLVATCSRQSP